MLFPFPIYLLNIAKTRLLRLHKFLSRLIYIMTQRLLTFSEEKCKYLVLNIIAHDVIHDYGNADSDRWQSVQKILKDFYQPGLTGGVKRGRSEMETETITVANPQVPAGPGPAPFTVFAPFGQQLQQQTVFNFPGQGQVIGNYKDSLDEFCIEPALQSFIDDIENEITMAFFHIYLTNKGRTLMEYIQFISHIPMIFNKKDSNMNNIYSDIEDVILYDATINIPSRLSAVIDSIQELERLFDMVGNFFNTDRQAITTIIYSYIELDYNEHEKKRVKRGGKSQRGGIPREALNDQDATTLTQAISNYLTADPANNPINDRIEKMKDCYQKTQANLNNDAIQRTLRDEYNAARKSIIDELRDIYISNNAEKYAKCLEQIKIMSDRTVRNLDVRGDITSVINSSVDVPRKIAQRAAAVEEARQRQIADDIRAAQSGNLTSEDKTLVGNFMKLIARLGLILTGCMNPDGTTPRFTDTTLVTEIETLKYIAGIKGGLIRTKDLDEILINHFDTNFTDATPTPKYRYNRDEAVTTRINCSFINKYIINNAAPIGNMSKLAFCPYTSVIDGMSQCSWGTANGDGIERGNMNFVINNGSQNSLYYNGALSIRPDSIIDANGNPTQASINFTVNCPGYGQIIGVKPLVTVSTAVDLQASVVLKKTLLAILSITGISEQNIFNFIDQNFQRPVDDPLSATGAQIPIFALIYREILFKGVGDLFQEINSVSKFGGYTMESYSCANKILSYERTDGNQIRCFLANDRPSGTRFIYMLLNGREDQINNRAFGGYYSKEKEVLAKRSTNANLCTMIRGGRRRKNTKKRSKHNKKQSRKLKA